MRWVRDYNGKDTTAPATDGTCNCPGTRRLMLIAASHDRDPPLDPYASGSAAQSLRKASHAPTATVAAVAEDAYQIANDETASVRAAPKAASADGAVSTTAADSTGEGEAPITIVGDTPTTTDYITGYRPPLPSDVTLPGRPVLTVALPLTGPPLSTPEAVLALETSPQSASRPVKFPLPRMSPTTPGDALEGRSSGSAPTPQSPPLPPRTVSATPAENGQPREEPPED